MNRIEKYKIFKTFYEKSEDIFKKISEADKNNVDFNEKYILSITPGGWNGGLDKRLVQIFYGNRPFDSSTILNGFNVEKKFLSEHGTTLEYLLLDNGNVLVSLSPAKTENLKPYEDFIIIDKLENIKKLLNKNYLRKHWNYFIAYMHITSLDGLPNIFHKLRIWWLRNFKEVAENGVVLSIKFKNFLLSILKWVLTIGLSGAIISVFSILNTNTKKDPSIKTLNDIFNKQEEIIFLLKHDDISSDVKNISDKLDKINHNIELLRIKENKK